MNNQPFIYKPQTVFYAELALWVWTAWTCIFGTYQSITGLPELENTLTEKLQGMLTINTHILLELILTGYLIVAVTSIWVIWAIGSGKHWARSSLMWGLIFEVLTSAWPPYHWGPQILANIPDFGLQIYALYVLYTKPGSDWFSNLYAKA